MVSYTYNKTSQPFISLLFHSVQKTTFGWKVVANTLHKTVMEICFLMSYHINVNVTLQTTHTHKRSGGGGGGGGVIVVVVVVVCVCVCMCVVIVVVVWSNNHTDFDIVTA